MPASFSLEQYCPTPSDQGNHGTCVAFANGYAIATLLYAKTHNITDKALIDKYAFSPTYLYELIKDPADGDCQNGSDPIQALVTMITGGDALIKTVPYQCGYGVTETAKREAVNYKIQDASILFAGKGMMADDKYVKDPQAMIDITKKSLLEGTPISTGFHLPESFFGIKSDVWYTTGADTLSDWKHNGHAMAIVGYDDNKAGGSFRVMNSWGTGWADRGFVWVRYPDFTKWCVLALQVFADPGTREPEEKKREEPKPQPSPAPAPTPGPSPAPPVPEPNYNEFALGGDVEFRLNTGESMPVSKISTRNLSVEEDVPVEDRKEDLVAYTMSGRYSSGTKFRFYMNIDQEAYVYAFATDLTGKVNLILPYDDMVSTHLGANSVVAFPSDSKVIKMDEQKGTDYLLVLYSKNKLDAKAIASQMSNMKGGLSKKIKTALGEKLIPKEKINYSPDKVAFTVKGKGTRNLMVSEDEDSNSPSGGSIVPLMIEIKHD